MRCGARWATPPCYTLDLILGENEDFRLKKPRILGQQIEILREETAIKEHQIFRISKEKVVILKGIGGMIWAKGAELIGGGAMPTLLHREFILGTKKGILEP